jgi:RNA polymerase sigma-70 factor (ECF subfamily)
VDLIGYWQTGVRVLTTDVACGKVSVTADRCHITAVGGVYMMKGKLKMAITSIDTAHSRSVLGDEEHDILTTAFETYWPKVCATLYRLVGDWDEAEDLALEVFWRLHVRPPRETDKLSSWLYRVATNVGFNALRSRKRRRHYEEAAEALKLQRATPLDPESEVERREAHWQVRHVLAQMKPRTAQLLILRHSGLSYADIAAVLRVACSSVGTLLARAEREFERRYSAMEERDETP